MSGGLFWHITKNDRCVTAEVSTVLGAGGFLGKSEQAEEGNIRKRSLALLCRRC